jgi:hypothetical protein
VTSVAAINGARWSDAAGNGMAIDATAAAAGVAVPVTNVGVPADGTGATVIGETVAGMEVRFTTWRIASTSTGHCRTHSRHPSQSSGRAM